MRIPLRLSAAGAVQEMNREVEEGERLSVMLGAASGAVVQLELTEEFPKVGSLGYSLTIFCCHDSRKVCEYTAANGVAHGHLEIVGSER